jgi:hypothetical protein
MRSLIDSSLAFGLNNRRIELVNAGVNYKFGW